MRPNSFAVSVKIYGRQNVAQHEADARTAPNPIGAGRKPSFTIRMCLPTADPWNDALRPPAKPSAGVTYAATQHIYCGAH
jgi:hypothetical protein